MCADNRITMTWRSYLFVCVLRYPIIIILQTYLKAALNMKYGCYVYYLHNVTKIISVLSIIFMHYIGLCVFSLRVTLLIIARIGVLYLIIISGRFYWHGSTLIPAWISNHIRYNVWDEITYPFLNFNGAILLLLYHIAISDQRPMHIRCNDTLSSITAPLTWCYRV